MRLGIVLITITSGILLMACQNTEYQFGNTVPAPTYAPHDDLGNVQENTQLNIIAPTSENAPTNTTIIPPEPIKVVQPKRSKPIPTQVTVAPEITPNEIATITPPMQIAQPATTNWQPNEALLIRGGELINGLQKEQGKKPSVADMQKRLQTHMGLSAEQAQQVIAKL